MSMLDNSITRMTATFVIGGILVAFIFFVLPASDMPNGLVSAISWLFNSLWKFDFMFPVLTALSCVSIILAIDILFASIKFILFLKKHATKT